MIRLVVSDNDMISLSTVVIRDDEVIPHMKDRRCKRSSYALSSTQLWDSHGILLSSQGISNHCFPHPSNIHQTSIEQQTAAFLRPFLLESGMNRPALTSRPHRHWTAILNYVVHPLRIVRMLLGEKIRKCLEQRMGLIPLFDQSIDWSNFNAT